MMSCHHGCTGRTHAKKMQLGVAFHFGVSSNFVRVWDPICPKPQSSKASTYILSPGFGTCDFPVLCFVEDLQSEIAVSSRVRDWGFT